MNHTIQIEIIILLAICLLFVSTAYYHQFMNKIVDAWRNRMYRNVMNANRTLDMLIDEYVMYKITQKETFVETSAEFVQIRKIMRIPLTPHIKKIWRLNEAYERQKEIDKILLDNDIQYLS